MEAGIFVPTSLPKFLNTHLARFDHQIANVLDLLAGVGTYIQDVVAEVRLLLIDRDSYLIRLMEFHIYR